MVWATRVKSALRLAKRRGQGGTDVVRRMKIVQPDRHASVGGELGDYGNERTTAAAQRHGLRRRRGCGAPVYLTALKTLPISCI